MLGVWESATLTPLVWTRVDAEWFMSEFEELSLVVVPATITGLYRYQIFKRCSDPTAYASINSGHCTRLQEALVAAEAVAVRLTTTR